jgi:hypothetical protein
MAQFPKAVELWRFYSLLIPIAAMGVNVISQILLVRARRGARFLRSIVEGVAAGILTMVLMEALLILRFGLVHDEVAVFILVNIPAYLALSYCYFNLANLGQSSIRIRMYSEIESAPAGVSVSDMSLRYSDAAFLEMRLQRLIESGDIYQRDGRYFLSRGRLALLAKVMRALKSVFLGKASQFD